MRLEISLRTFGLCSIVFCLSEGTPSTAESGKPPLKKRHLGSVRDTLYTNQEDKLILSHLETLNGEYRPSIWKEIADSFKITLESGCSGFNVKRAADGIRYHTFRQMLREDRPPGSVTPPDSVKRMLEQASPFYTDEEDKFINGELSIAPEKYIYSTELWARIKRIHDWSRSVGAKGFRAKRTATGLLTHFTRFMIPKRLVSDVVIQKYPRILELQERSSRKRRYSRGKKASSEEDVAEMEETDEELEDIPEELKAGDEPRDENAD